MVFNNVNFRRGSARHGSDKDYDSIYNTFSRFGFSVIQHRDTTKAGIIDILTETAKHYKSSYRCFVCVFLSHGKSGDIMVDVEGNDVSIRELVRLLDGNNCQRLRGKPKLFFVQMCRGNVHMPGVETDGSDDEDHDMLSNPPVPVNQDFLVAYCTTPGYYSYRNPSTGSRFIQTLTQVLQERGHTDDILQVMTRVTNLVGQQGKFKRSRPRKGSEKDFQNIKKTFNRFGFMVVEHKNLKKAQMVQILQKTANEFQDSWHCFVCFFLSHGKDGDTMYDCENDDVSIREMVKIFEGSNCPGLVGKPKLFFVQMCRGNTHQPGVETDGDDDEGPPTGLMSDPPVPQNQDVLIAFSTSPGYMAYRDTTDGSWFIHTLTQMCRGGPADFGEKSASSTAPSLGKKKKKVLPVDQDILMAFSTGYGAGSYYDYDKGSWFIQTLTEVLQKRGHLDDILQVLQRTTALVSKRAGG
ncbi:hypothetical protein BaRGS_00003929 [Batillaria attramentaria]|uniref:Uncharacterized protein n=1 Tax=Batillaria attramentaria TaxID=370345 RepID=A0ABD0M0P3_9CAEN